MEHISEELDEILLGKRLDEFYFAILEKKLTTRMAENGLEELNSKDAKFIGVPKEEVDGLYQEIMETKGKFADKIAGAVMQLLYVTAKTRQSAIITVVDGKVYNIATTTGPELVDLEKYKIVNYENLTSFYDDSTCKIRYFTAEDDSRIKGRIVQLDTTDDSIIDKYEETAVRQKSSKDLTHEFFIEATNKEKTPAYIKKK